MKIEKLHILDNEGIAALSETLGGYAEFFKDEIKRGASELWRIDNGESYAITRLERDEWLNETTLVCCCYKGANLKQWTKHLLSICDKNKWNARLHTTNKTISKLMRKKYGFSEPELVLTRGHAHE